jgi:hypothetical protein
VGRGVGVGVMRWLTRARREVSAAWDSLSDGGCKIGAPRVEVWREYALWSALIYL